MTKLARVAFLAVVSCAVCAGMANAQEKKKGGRFPPEGGDDRIGKIVKVDAEKNTITIKGDDDKEHVVKLESNTKLVGPRGREIKGLSDRAVKEGARVYWVLDKDGKVKELHLQSAGPGGIRRKGAAGGSEEADRPKSKDKDKN